jgi:hypothetical protein
VLYFHRSHAVSESNKLLSLVPNNAKRSGARSPHRPLLEVVCSECTPYHEGRSSLGSSDKQIPSQTSSCSFCALIGRLFEHFVGKRQCNHRYSLLMRSTHDLQFCFVEVGISTPWRQEKHVHVQLSCAGTSSTYLAYFQLRVYVELQTPEHPLGGSRKVYANPVAAEGLARLKDWFGRCVSDHAECALGANPGQPLLSFVSTRLIEITDNSFNHVHLVSVTSAVQYVALSYCWGTSKQPGTTQSNLPSRQQQINVSGLPKTLQDAILVTWALGFRYIWIDSLCIVQDDLDDWATESSNMADIYSGACLVIAATRAKDCAEGFLQSRSEPLVLDWTLPSKPFAEVTARRTISHDCISLNSTIFAQPLHERAWAMQERELARRIVHFLPDEVLWRCQKTTCCECGISEEPFWTHSKLSSLAAFPSRGDCDSPNEHAFSSAWIRLLMVYTRLGITRPTDALPALSGVARYVEHLHPGQYIAGLWEKDIAIQLAWFLPADMKDARPGLKGPSFSWISASQIFMFPTYEKEYSSHCAFLAATQTLATANPYGHVLDCSITLRGRTIQVAQLSVRVSQTRQRETRSGALFAFMDDPVWDFHHLLDQSGNTNREDDGSDGPCIVFLELFQSTGHLWRFPWDVYQNSVITALVLQRDAGEMSYTRIGVASNIDPTWYDEDGVEEIVTIT